MKKKGVDVHLDELFEREGVVEERPPALSRVVRVLNGLIGIAIGLFVAVLGVHVALVYTDAELGNAFARSVTSWAQAIDLGVNRLFAMADERLQVAADNSVAAVLWVMIGAALTTMLDRVLLPDRDRRVWYRRGAH